MWLIEEIKFAYDIVKGAYKLISSRKNQEQSVYFHDLVKEFANENETYRFLVESAAKNVMSNNQDSIGMWDIFSSSDELYNTYKNQYNLYNYTIANQIRNQLRTQRQQNLITLSQFNQRLELLKILPPLIYLHGEVTKLSSQAAPNLISSWS